MPSPKRRNGSSTAWRKLRPLILQRDQHTCQMPNPDGTRCLAYANTVDHIVPLSQGGAPLDPANLRAACARHNYAAGAQLANAQRPPRITPLRMSTEAGRLVHLLDRINAPTDAGRTVARRLLLDLGHQPRSDPLDAACAYRRQRAQAPTPTPTQTGSHW